MKHTKVGWVVLFKCGKDFSGKTVWEPSKKKHIYWEKFVALFSLKKHALSHAKTYGRGNAKVVKAVQTTEWEE